MKILKRLKAERDGQVFAISLISYLVFDNSHLMLPKFITFAKVGMQYFMQYAIL